MLKIHINYLKILLYGSPHTNIEKLKLYVQNCITKPNNQHFSINNFMHEVQPTKLKLYGCELYFPNLIGS